MKRYKFSVEEIKRLTKSMIVLVDSQEKKNSHILGYFDKQGIPYQVGAIGIWRLLIYDSCIGSR